MKNIVLSVHGLVDFLLRRGDIDNRIYSQASMNEGTRIHLRYQLMQKGSYLKEQALSCEYHLNDYNFILQGRADGIIITSSYPIIDEIKTCVIPLEDFYNSQKEWHLGQALVYAYMYAKMNNLEKVGVRLTYISQLDNDYILTKNFTYSFEELDEYMFSLLTRYLNFYQNISLHQERLKISAQGLAFPYDKYRQGQKELAKYVYGAITSKNNLFVEAPTGIGKTISTLFPSIKALGNSSLEKIFYLSAKNIGKNIALNACKIMNEKGLDAKAILISAKEKICFTPEGVCNPTMCPYTIKYYDKINDAILDLFLHEDVISQEIIVKYANKYEICPFEYQLDVSLFMDIIICDYNYFFDPLVYLKRYFDNEQTPYVALIDEAHNLVDRFKDMYSASISLSDFVLLKKDIAPYKRLPLKSANNRLIKYLSSLPCDEDYVQVDNFPSKVYSLLEDFFHQCQVVFKDYPEVEVKSIVNVFRKVNRFLKISDFYSPDFATYYDATSSLVLNIRCLDSSTLIKDTLKKLTSSTFFSATLTPIDYYVNCLGGDENSPLVKLASPFDHDNLLTLVRYDVSTRYKDRDKSLEQICQIIYDVIEKKIGNYLVFFPSYQYLEKVYQHLEKKENIIFVKQTPEMNESEKEKFLSFFMLNPAKTTLGFAVLGGAFSEGIDLVDSKLIGSIIVGVGIPLISYERDLIKNHYQDLGYNGYDYAYVYPGITKVIQAAGRVIRSENDVGVVVFIDERFSYNQYASIFSNQFKNAHFLSSSKRMNDYLTNFWKEH